MTLLGTVLAGATIDLTPGDQFSALGGITITGLISAAIILILVVAALVFFFMLIYGGIKYITSGGDKAQTEAARGTITAALIGLVIVFSAWAIITLINAFFGIDILQLTLPTAGA
jgi:hypothetical protein